MIKVTVKFSTCDALDEYWAKVKLTLTDNDCYLVRTSSKDPHTTLFGENVNCLYWGNSLHNEQGFESQKVIITAKSPAELQSKVNRFIEQERETLQSVKDHVFSIPEDYEQEIHLN